MTASENWILFVCNNRNQVSVLAPVAAQLAASERQVRFLSLDSYYAQGASEALEELKLPYTELPSNICKGRFYSHPEERQSFVLDAAIAVEEFFVSYRPAAVVLGHDIELVEQLIIRACERNGIRTARIQDGIQSWVPRERLQEFDISRLPFDGGCELLMVWNESLKAGLLERGIRGKIVLTGNPRMDAISNVRSKRPGTPPYRILLAAQCWTTHLLMTFSLELAFYERLISRFLSRDDTEVIFKLHPTQLYPEVYEELPKRFGNRLRVVREGDSLDLIREVDVVATITSTVGLEAIQLGVPLMRLPHLIVDDAKEFLRGEQAFLELLHSDRFPHQLEVTPEEQEAWPKYRSPMDGQCATRAAEAIAGLIKAHRPTEAERPDVSVLMTHSDGEILGSVYSVLRPAKHTVEVVLVDTSPDSSLKTIIDRKLKDPRVRVYTAPGATAGTAFNLGLSHCRGEIVAQLGQDCIALPGWVDELYQALMSSPDAAMAVCAFVMRDKGGLINQVQIFPEEQSPRDFAAAPTAPINMLAAGFRKSLAPRLSDQNEIEGQLLTGVVGELDNPRRLRCLTSPLFLTPFNPRIYEHAQFGHGYRITGFLNETEQGEPDSKISVRVEAAESQASLVCLNADRHTLEVFRDTDLRNPNLESEILIVPAERGAFQCGDVEALLPGQRVNVLDNLTSHSPSEQLSRVLETASGDILIVLADGLRPFHSDLIANHLEIHRMHRETLVVGGSFMSGAAANEILSLVCEKMGHLSGFIGAQEPSPGTDVNHFSVPLEILRREQTRLDGRYRTMWGELAWLGETVERAGGKVLLQPDLTATYSAPIRFIDWLRETVARSEDMVRLINRAPIFMPRLLGMTAITTVNLEKWEQRVRDDAEEIVNGIEQVVAFIDEVGRNKAASSLELEPILADVLASINEHLQRRALVRTYLQAEKLAPLGFAGLVL